jgi:polygalacturonase
MFNPNTPDYEAPNGDGVDIGSSTNVVIRNSVLDMSDDQICVRAGQGRD